MKALFSMLVVGVLLSAAPAWSQERKINIEEYTFTPADVTVTTGTRVTWANHDQVPHSVVAQGNKFHSTALDTDDSYSFTFTQPGTYHYFCSLHPHMTGTVTVVNDGK